MSDEVILKETRFTDCEFPGVGVPGENGYAHFVSRDEAEDLLVYLNGENHRASYYYAYELKWDGHGHYDLLPSYEYDHDKDIIYTGTFVKQKVGSFI